ncbi:MAG: hypothetical protein AAFR97_15345, partial [Bacteroidota bacterium]
MQSEDWAIENRDARFEVHEGYPSMYFNDSGADATGNSIIQAKGSSFYNGTIEFDLAIDEGARFMSFYFRQQDENNSEHVYLRAFFAGNHRSSGGFQYAAVIDGVNYWDLSFPYQTGVTMLSDGKWNHIKLIVRDRQMLAYVNDMERPALYIPILDGIDRPGGIGVDGKGWIANLQINPDQVGGLSAGMGYDPLHNDIRYLRTWQVTNPIDFPFGREPVEADLPGSETQWSGIQAEHHGLINLSRPFGQTPRGERRLVWLKATIKAGEAVDRTLDLGISDEVYVYLNGSPLYVGRNPYNTPAMLEPSGRASIENTQIDLPLKEGENELLIGVANYFFGWGIVARLNDGSGLDY